MNPKQYTIKYFDELESTNRYAKANLESLKDKSVICAAIQAQGKGRLGRTWFCEKPGNVCFSIVLKPGMPLRDLPVSNITQFMSVIICELLDSCGITPQIKWPNDIMVEGKKIAGILSEVVIQGENIKGIVVGVGLNLNLDLKDLKKIDKPAVSLNLLTGSTLNASEFTEKLVGNFVSEYDNFLTGGFEYIKSRYINRCAFLGSEILVMNMNKEQKGIAKRINDDGTLLLEDTRGESTILAGDIL